MEGFVHLKMPLWARRLITRLISVIPVLICVSLTAGQSAQQEHQALNTLMNNSQVFLSFALPFSMIPLLMMTNSEVEMGKRFKNSLWVKVLGWISVIVLTVLNFKGMPDAISDFFGDNPTAAQMQLSNMIAYVLIAIISGLLIWTIYELYKGDKHYAELQKAKKNA